MRPPNALTFFHAPHSRSGAVRILLEELGAPFDLHALNLKAGEQREPGYLAINPMGKVPALKDGDALITEQVAIFLYLADRFPQAGFAPAIGDSLRGPYLRWLVFYGSCFEPAVLDRAQKSAPASQSSCPYGDYDSMLKTLTDQLARGPWILGAVFSAADLLWGSALDWTTQFKLVPELPVIRAYIERVNARPAVKRARAADDALAAAQG